MSEDDETGLVDNSSATEKHMKELKKAIQTSFILDSGQEGLKIEDGKLVENKWNRIIEQVYDEKEGSKFCVYNVEENKVEGLFFHHWTKDGCYKPIQGEDVTKHVVLLPSDASDYESEEKLANEIESFIRKWAGLSEQFYKVATWYILTSWVYDRYDTINYLRALGDTGTGKSRFMDTLGGLCYKFIKISGAATPAAAYRIQEKWRGTIGIEEGDLRESDETNDIVKWLNCGFEKNNPIIRCDKNDPSKLDFFDPFGPKVIATRREFQDSATEARCLTERMSQDSSKPDTKTDDFYKERQTLRNKLLMFRFKNYYRVDIKRVLDFDLTSLEPRLRQASRPFLALVWDKPELLAQFKKYLEDYNKEIIEVRSSSYTGQIVNALADLILDSREFITCQDLLEKVGGDKITTKSIGKQLRSLHLDLLPKFIDGKTKKVIDLDKKKLGIIFNRYISEKETLSKLSSKHYSITEITDITETTENKKESQESLDITESNPHTYDGNFSNSVILKCIRNAKQKPNGQLIRDNLSALGMTSQQIVEYLASLLKKGDVFEINDHYLVLE